MKIIMLKGPDNSGKTTTLNLIHDELVKKMNATIVFKVELGWKGDDIASTLDYNNRKVAIFSMGDYVEDIKRAIDYFEHKSADVLIIANRNKHQFDNLVHQSGNVLINKPKVRKTQICADNINYMNQIIAMI